MDSANVSTISANINNILVLNGTNFKDWKDNIEIILGCMDLDLVLRVEQPASLTNRSYLDEKTNFEKLDRSNRMSLMIIKRGIPEAFRGAVSDKLTTAKQFLAEIEQSFVKNDKAETSTLLQCLISMKYNDKGNIRELIMDMSPIASKLKALKLALSDDLLVHLILISLPAQYSQFKVSYNCQKEKWTLNELISYCVQEEERLKQDRTESTHLASTSKDKGKKRKNNDNKFSVHLRIESDMFSLKRVPVFVNPIFSCMQIRYKVEVAEEIVIVGGGIAGLATSLGLHRMGVKSLVLESSEKLRVTGFAFLTWMNAWKAMDALGIGDSLRQQHVQLQGTTCVSATTGLTTSRLSFLVPGKCGNHEVRCLRRRTLLETLEKELPQGTIRFGSKVVSIEQTHNLKNVHLADGTVIKTKVLIGCDGVNSMVAKWLGLQEPVFMGRIAIRGFVENPDGHGLGPKFLQFFGDGFRGGFLPCDDKTVYWFFTHSPSHNKQVEDDPAKMKQYVLSKLKRLPAEVIDVVERTQLDTIFCHPLKLRFPAKLLWGDICKGTACVVGDAFHPMTPDLAQGACSALEDSVTLARCIGEALLRKPEEEDEEYNRIKRGLEKYAKDRRWRCSQLIATAYVVGLIQQSSGAVMNFFRDECLSEYLAKLFLKEADFDCGKLDSP